MYLEQVAVECLVQLKSHGLTIQIVTDPAKAASLLDATSRDYSTFPLDGERVAFTRKNAFWIFSMLGEDVHAGCGVRVDDLGDETFSDYYIRTSQPTFGSKAFEVDDGLPANVLKGRVAYCGDLVSPKASGKPLSANRLLRLFCFYVQFRIFTDFDADWSYCVMRDRQFMRGAAQAYGFLSSLPFCWDWCDCPYPGGKPEWISFLPKADIGRLAKPIKDLLND